MERTGTEGKMFTEWCHGLHDGEVRFSAKLQNVEMYTAILGKKELMKKWGITQGQAT